VSVSLSEPGTYHNKTGSSLSERRREGMRMLPLVFSVPLTLLSYLVLFWSFPKKKVTVMAVCAGSALRNSCSGHSPALSRDDLLSIYSKCIPFLINFTITFTAKKKNMAHPTS
jgi:hypothetical protein